jgi:hypothetical protein
MTWGQVIIASAVFLLGVGFGIFVVLRLRAEPVEDKDDLERVRLIEEGLGLRKRPHQRDTFLSAVLNVPAEAFLPSIAIGNFAL